MPPRSYSYPTPISIRPSSHEERTLLEACALHTGISLSRFMIEAASTEAHRIIKEVGLSTITDFYSSYQEEQAAKLQSEQERSVKAIRNLLASEQ